MDEISPRKLAMACRCQLLTGSFAGRLNGCECDGPQNCKLGNRERTQLELHMKVIEAKEKALRVFQEQGN